MKNYLKQIGPLKLIDKGTICVALVHNERPILQDFLNHYRDLGAVSFLLIDDNSNDGSLEFLLDQPDVTLFQPVSGSTYAKHKKEWRSSLLDKYAAGNWCLLPDIDEHFIYVNVENKTLQVLEKELTKNGDEALFTVMVDMYADKPLSDHFFKYELKGSLRDAFPLFDGARDPVTDYRLIPPPANFLIKYPSPRTAVYGGLRERLFYRSNFKYSFFQGWLLRQFAHLGKPTNPTRFGKISNAFVRLFCKKLFGDNPLNCTKLILIKWQKGMVLSGGAHAVNKEIQISNQIAAVLHYKFTQGTNGIEYSANRGQHAGGAQHYKQILSKGDVLSKSPVNKRTKRYEDSRSLKGIIR